VLELLRDSPEALLLSDDYMQGLKLDATMVDDPIAYLGGKLKYTTAEDPRLRAVQSLLAYTEALATQHGQLVDAHPGVREQIDRLARTFTHLV
jgi:hypothetical protein